MGDKGLRSKLEDLKGDKTGVVQSLLTIMRWRVKLDGTSPLVFRCANVVSTVAVHLLFVLTAADLFDCADLSHTSGPQVRLPFFENCLPV
jgi:hypothetical protein